MPNFFELNSIRSRMVSGFLFLTFLIFVVVLVSLYILNRNNEISRIHGNINQLEILTLSLIKSDNDFFDLDATNEVYFTTRKSFFLESRDSLNKLIDFKMDEVFKKQRENYFIRKNLRLIDSTLTVYNKAFESLEGLLYTKGFKDYGMEGQMRAHAHKLEVKDTGIDITQLLYLRRHEKDFFLRHDIMYVDKFNTLADFIEQDLENQHAKNKNAIYHLKEYARIFNELVNIQTQIGLSSHAGLRYQLNNLTFSLSNQYFELAEFSSRLSSQSQKRAMMFYLSIVCGAIVFSIITGLWISKRLSEPIARLSKLVGNVTTENSSRNLDLNFRNAANEINTLTKSFILLMDQTKAQMSELKQKSKLLRHKNKQLKKVNTELDSFLYSTAHDLRSPLTSLLGLINIMRIDNKQEELVAYLDMMEKSINRSESFISQIVSYSKNKRMEIHPERLNLKNLIWEIFESHKFVNGNEKIMKEVNIDDAIPFYSDFNRLTVLFNNLISNAIRYADFDRANSFIKINIIVYEEEVIIKFADNGVGIGKEHVGKIFDMFYRAHTDSKGSGLGLFLFKETLKRLKGFASVESDLGKGTIFFIRIPNLSNSLSLQQELQLDQTKGRKISSLPAIKKLNDPLSV